MLGSEVAAVHGRQTLKGLAVAAPVPEVVRGLGGFIRPVSLVERKWLLAGGLRMRSRLQRRGRSNKRGRGHGGRKATIKTGMQHWTLKGNLSTKWDHNTAAHLGLRGAVGLGGERVLAAHEAPRGAVVRVVGQQVLRRGTQQRENVT